MEKGTEGRQQPRLLNENRSLYLNQQQIEEYSATTMVWNRFFGWMKGLLAITPMMDNIDDTVFGLKRAIKKITVGWKKIKNTIYELLSVTTSSLSHAAAEWKAAQNIVELTYAAWTLFYEDDAPSAHTPQFYIANKFVVVPTFRSSKGWQGACRS